MTTPTREQVVQWADESVFDIVKADCYHEFDEVADSGNLWITRRLTDFAALARADLEATVKEQEQSLQNLCARIHRDGGHYAAKYGLEKAISDADIAVADAYSRIDEQAAEIERLSERRCEICGYAEHHREHTGCLRQQLAAAQLHIEQLRGAMLMMLCDSEGKCCMAGSDEDRFIIDTALSTKPDLSALEAERQSVAEACAMEAINWGNARKDNHGGHACRNLAEAIRAGQWREHL